MIVEVSTAIDAPQDVVWAATIDVERWPQWMPTVQSVKRLDSGPFQRGSAAMIKQPGLPEAKWVVTAMTPGERFTWETTVRGMHMAGTHDLSAQGNATRSVLRIEITGLLARLMWPILRSSIRRTLERENAALKTTSEAAADAAKIP